MNSLETDEGYLLPFAGTRLGVDLRAGLPDPRAGLDELRRIRSDKLIPWAPSMYEQLGSVQPPETFGV